MMSGPALTDASCTTAHVPGTAEMSHVNNSLLFHHCIMDLPIVINQKAFTGRSQSEAVTALTKEDCERFDRLMEDPSFHQGQLANLFGDRHERVFREDDPMFLQDAVYYGTSRLRASLSTYIGWLNTGGRVNSESGPGVWWMDRVFAEVVRVICCHYMGDRTN
jgi:hypothetical protein